MFHDSLIGECLRSNLKKEAERLYRQTNDAKTRSTLKRLDDNWVPIELMKRVLKSWARQQGLQIVRTQIPLVAANGMTIPKAQGSTILGVVVSTRTSKGVRKLTREEIYVACSRSPSEELLWIDGEFLPPEPPKENDPVTLELIRIRNRNEMSFELKFLQDFDCSFTKFYFQNIQSLPAHFLDIEADRCFKSADILAFVEPHLLETDNINISGFSEYFRRNCNYEVLSSTRNSEGIYIAQNSKTDFLNVHL